MLKVMLVDDEPYILQGLQVLIDWESGGFEIAKLCSNGKEALKYLKENDVDLVISDIKMPENFLRRSRRRRSLMPSSYCSQVMMISHIRRRR